MDSELFVVEATGTTVEDAVEEGLRHFQCTRAEVDIQVLKTPRRVLFGLFGTKLAQVRIALADRGQRARILTVTLLRSLGFEGQVDLVSDLHCHRLTVTSPDSRQIIGRYGQTLEALQLLVQGMTDRLSRDRTPLLLDCDGYRQRRDAYLHDLAQSAIRRVRSSQQPVIIEPLPAAERRTLHLAIQDADGFESRTVGQGTLRKMVVSLRRVA